MRGRTSYAVLGGTYDPPHEKHVQTIATLSSIEWIDHTIVIPAIQNPIKPWQPLFAFDMRIRMLNHSLSFYSSYIDSKSTISVLDIAKDLPRPTFIVDAVDSLKAHLPSASPWVCLSSESRNWTRLADLSAAIPRGLFVLDRATDALSAPFLYFLSVGFTNLHAVLMNYPAASITSSEIRAAISNADLEFIYNAPIAPYVRAKIDERVSRPSALGG